MWLLRGSLQGLLTLMPMDNTYLMINKVKNWLGIEGVVVRIVSTERREGSETIAVSMEITSKSTQQIDGLRLIVKERYSRGRRKSKLVDEYTLGEKVIPIDQPIIEGESILLTKEIDYQLLLSEVDEMTMRGNIFKRGAGLFAKLIKGAKSEYYVIAELSVKGNRLRPYDRVTIDSL